MHLHYQCGLSFDEAFKERELPQRTISIEALGRRLASELKHVVDACLDTAQRAEHHAPKVIRQLEVFVGHPSQHRGMQRGRHHVVAEPWHLMGDVFNSLSQSWPIGRRVQHCDAHNC